MPGARAATVASRGMDRGTVTMMCQVARRMGRGAGVLPSAPIDHSLLPPGHMGWQEQTIRVGHKDSFSPWLDGSFHGYVCALVPILNVLVGLAAPHWRLPDIRRICENRTGTVSDANDIIQCD